MKTRSGRLRKRIGKPSGSQKRIKLSKKSTTSKKTAEIIRKNANKSPSKGLSKSSPHASECRVLVAPVLEGRSPLKLNKIPSTPHTWLPRTLGGKECKKELRSVEERRERILKQLSRHHVPDKLPGLESQEKLVMNLLKNTISSCQNNAALLMGPHGCGKSATLRKVLRDLKHELVLQGKSFIEVYISGQVVTTDTQAMESIVSQVCLENEVELDGHKFKSFSENLEFLRSALRAGKFESMPIFFILDDFDLFASRSRRQTLLYNLCDLLQEYTAQLALVGLTTRFDAYELLEKRIRSRITYRVIVFPPPLWESAKQAITNALTLQGGSEDVKAHNKAMKAIFNDRTLQKHLRATYSRVKNLEWLQMVATFVLSTADKENMPGVNDFVEAVKTLDCDSPQERLKDCTSIQITIITALGLLEQKVDDENTHFNFAQAFDLYHRHVSKTTSEFCQKFSMESCLESFKELHEVGLLSFTEAGDATNPVNLRFRKVSLNFAPRLILDCVKNKKVLCPSWLQQWVRNASI
ncbi:hypothetical protein AAMO2058_001101000 [Amorphochlora amoebiformis]